MKTEVKERTKRYARPLCKAGSLYQNDSHGDNIIVLCTEDEKEVEFRQDDMKVSVVVIRDVDDSGDRDLYKAGEVHKWATGRMVHFDGVVELWND